MPPPPEVVQFWWWSRMGWRADGLTSGDGAGDVVHDEAAPEGDQRRQVLVRLQRVPAEGAHHGARLRQRRALWNTFTKHERGQTNTAPTVQPQPLRHLKSTTILPKEQLCVADTPTTCAKGPRTASLSLAFFLKGEFFSFGFFPVDRCFALSEYFAERRELNFLNQDSHWIKTKVTTNLNVTFPDLKPI